MTAEGEEDGVGEGKGKERGERGAGRPKTLGRKPQKNACRAFSAQPETDESLEARFWWCARGLGGFGGSGR